MTRRQMPWFAAVAAVALVVAGCGSSGGDETSASSANGSPAETGQSSADSTGSGGARTDTGSSAGESGGDPLVFGLITDTSGGASAYAPYGKVGIEMAVKEINAAGGIQGRQIKVISESDGSDTTKTPTLTRRLIDDGADMILLGSGSASAIAAKPVCEAEDVLCVAPTNLSATIVNPPQADNIFILGPTSAGIGTAFKEGMSKAGYHNIAVIADDVSTIQGYVPVLEKPLTDAGMKIVAEEKVATDASDVSAQIARVKQANPDAVLVMSLGGQTEALIQSALHEQLPDVQRFSLASIGNQPTTWDLADPGALDGLVYIGSFDPSNPRTKEFSDKLAKRSGDYTALTAYTAQGYDGVYLVKEALDSVKDLDDASSYVPAFEKITGYEPHYGQPDFTMSFTPDKHVGSDGNCGMVLATFGPDNKPADPWSVYQPNC